MLNIFPGWTGKYLPMRPARPALKPALPKIPVNAAVLASVLHASKVCLEPAATGCRDVDQSRQRGGSWSVRLAWTTSGARQIMASSPPTIKAVLRYWAAATPCRLFKEPLKWTGYQPPESASASSMHLRHCCIRFMRCACRQGLQEFLNGLCGHFRLF